MRRERSKDRNPGPPLRCPPAPIRLGAAPLRPARPGHLWAGEGVGIGEGALLDGERTTGWGAHGWVGTQGMGWHIGNKMKQLDGEGTAG